MKSALVSVALLGVWVSAWSAAGAESARPGWAERYLTEPPPQWDGWRNSLAPRGEAVTLTLADEGRTDYVIVVPAEPTLAETRAASELQLWLGQITGAEFPIVPDSTPIQARELSVGRTVRASAAARKREAEAAANGYALVVEGERVLLLGPGPTGPLLGALALLEEDLGVRWYEAPPMAGENWDARIKDMNEALNTTPWALGEHGTYRVPHSPSLRARIVPRVSRPAIPVRHLDFMITSMPWGLRNRFNGGWAQQYAQHWYMHGGGACHTFHWLVPPAKHFAEHPEYFSLVGGKRQWENAQLCLANPEVAERAAETAIDALRHAGVTRRMIDVSAMDWGGHCECGECRKIEAATGAWSGVLLTFVNRVAERVAKEIPDATVTTLSYWDSNRPPTTGIRAHPNVAVRFCLDWGASFTWPYHSFFDGRLAEPPRQSGNKWTAQRQSYARWREVSPRLHLWMYPSQYRHTVAPMPNLGAVAENIRFFAEQQAESVYLQYGGSDLAGRPLRNWVFAKLLWEPTRNVDELLRDFILGGYYGAAGPEVLRYYALLWEHCARYTDFSRERDWIYAIQSEGMYQHGFIERARALLDHALGLAGDELTRKRVELLKLGVVYVEAVVLYMQMRDGETPPDVARYQAIADELGVVCERLGIHEVGFYDGSRTIGGASEFLAEMRKVRERRFDQRFLPPESWGAWTFRWDLEDRGVAEGWSSADPAAARDWPLVTVPAFLADTPAGNAIGYGWYRTTFTLPAGHVGKAVELEFGGVDEQAWVFVNGKPAGEHTLQSEFMPGQEVTVADLWDRPFTFTVTPELLRAGENVLVVRIHNSAFNAGIHQPVQIYLPEASFRDGCDGAIIAEDFGRVATGAIPAAWRRQIQERDGQVFGLAEVSRHFARTPTLHLRDQRSHVAVWSVSDEVLPAGNRWAVQFDFRLTGALIYKASDEGPYSAANAGAAFGLKRGQPGSADFLPLVQLDNGETAGEDVTLLGLGEVLATGLSPEQWHRLVIHRDGTTWHFYLDDELKKTVDGRDTDLRGYAFGSFRNWQHVAQDIHYANLRIGNFIGPTR
jgi:hypothetical protein